MPSHIFTRLGLWDESIHANLAVREVAHQQGDTGEELHAMDYLVYAYLQMARYTDAAQIIQQLKNMPELNAADFKIAYASTAMPVRYAVERHQWADAAAIVPPTEAPPHVAAVAVWARGLGLARTGRTAEAREKIVQLILATVRVTDHRPGAIIDLGLFTGCGDDYRAGFGSLRPTPLADKALDAVVAAGEAVLRN